jgi:hypothetical protein
MFMLHAWMLAGFFWRLPSWLHHLTLGEILGTLSYLLVHGLVESLLILGLLLLLTALLPANWLREVFMVRGTTIAVVVLGSIMEYIDRVGGGHLVDGFIAWLVISTGLAVGLAFLSAKVAVLAKGISSLAERFTVFVYIQAPLVILSVIIIVVRNFFAI